MWLDENPNPARAVTNWSRSERCVMLFKYENGSRLLAQSRNVPFVNPEAVIRKLCLIHQVVLAACIASPEARGH
jgi:hypothetical protein